MAGRRGSRDEWQKRVERWADSGLTAKQFAAETGINAGTLQFWKYKLKAGAGSSQRQGTKRVAMSSLVEVRPISVAVESRFEIELSDGRRLRVPAVFEPTALRALLAALEPAS